MVVGDDLCDAGNRVGAPNEAAAKVARHVLRVEQRLHAGMAVDGQAGDVHHCRLQALEQADRVLLVCKQP